jgi:hypothetical protein
MEHARCIHEKTTRFLCEEDGAVTVDWIVLTGTIIFLGMAVALTIGGELPVIAQQIAGWLSNREVGATGY